MDPHRMRARELRLNPTEAERRLWHALKGQQLGVKFRRQVPVGPYILDFACLPLRLGIELDGGQHAGSHTDAARAEWIRSQGYRLLRFWNHQVLSDLPSVLEVILRTIEE